MQTFATRSQPLILVVDDEPTALVLIEALLSRHGFEILTADSGAAALALAQEHQPELILLDVRMPGMDGFAACRLLKEATATRDIPVVFLSGLAEAGEKVRGFNLGAVDYITKPFNDEEVLARVNTHLNLSQRLRAYAALLDRQVAEKALGEDSSEGLAAREMRLLQRAVDILMRDLRDPPTLVDLAHRVGTNERKLSEAFKAHFGLTVFAFLREQRLRQASQLLRSTDQPIQIIAHRLGYKNAGDFTTSFKKRFGVPPREYRQAVDSSA